MGTRTPPPVVDGDVVRAGTSLFHRRTREVVWVTAARDGTVHLETVTGSFKMDAERFERRVEDGDIVVETRPPADGTVGSN